MGLAEREHTSGKRSTIIIAVLIAILLLIISGIVAMYIIFKEITYTEPIDIRTTTTTSTTTTSTTTTTTSTTITTSTTTTTTFMPIVRASCYKDSDCGIYQNLSTCSDDRSQVIKKSVQPMCMNPSTEGAYCWNRTAITGIIACTDVKTDSEGNIIRQSKCLSGGCTK